MNVSDLLASPAAGHCHISLSHQHKQTHSVAVYNHHTEHKHGQTWGHALPSYLHVYVCVFGRGRGCLLTNNIKLSSKKGQNYHLLTDSLKLHQSLSLLFPIHHINILELYLTIFVILQMRQIGFQSFHLPPNARIALPCCLFLSKTIR